MLLSEILNQMGCTEYKVEAEKSFRFLALSASNLTDPHCIFLDNEKYLTGLSKHVTMIITNLELAPCLRESSFGLCITAQPRQLFFEIHNYLSEQEGYKRDNFTTLIGEGCIISPLASISKNNVIIGKRVIIEEFVVIRENSVIGDDSIIRAGTIIGGLGYEFKRLGDSIMSVAHAGGVKIGNHVEIQYNGCVDRGVYPWDDTEIGDYTKIDNLVHIAHGVKVSKNVMIVANSGIGGRTMIGQNSWIGFGATITNGISIGENARVNIGSVATKNVPDGGNVTGNFAIAHEKFIRNLKHANLDDISQ